MVVAACYGIAVGQDSVNGKTEGVGGNGTDDGFEIMYLDEVYESQCVANTESILSWTQRSSGLLRLVANATLVHRAEVRKKDNPFK